jgi:hypothetical protein
MPLYIFLSAIKCSCILLCEQKSLKFKFDLNSIWFVIYKTILKKKKDFLISKGFWAEFLARPSRPPPACVACTPQPAGAMTQQSIGVHPHSKAESDPIGG